ncbi:MAG: acyl-CoA thioesterase [Gammaproteobacteria bacterium]|nr:acyl-CoA thioesterase [Gammaproteobacteria bacterium]
MSGLLQDFPVTICLPVEWGQMDAFNHVNNIIYFRYFESARIAYFEKAGVLTYMQEHGVGPILKHTQCRFRIPLRYPDQVQVGARVTDLGDNEFEMSYRVVSSNADAVAAEGTGTIVCVDYHSAAKVKIPDALRKAIADLEATKQSG